jgi:hypothetical protein
MNIIEVLGFTTVQLQAILKSHIYYDIEGTKPIVEKLKKVVSTGEDEEIDLIELWKLRETSDPDKLKGTEFEPMANEILPILEKAMDDYIGIESYPPTTTRDLGMNDFRLLISCTYDDGEPSEPKTFMLFLVSDNSDNSEEMEVHESYYLKFDAELFLSMYRTVIDRKAKCANRHHHWHTTETIVVFCKVDENPAYKHPVYIVVDFLVDVKLGD